MNYPFLNMQADTYLSTLVYDVITGNDCSHCRLCLKVIENDYFHFNDDVSINDTENFVALSEIISKLMGRKVDKEIPAVDFICVDCVNKSIEAYKFIELCDKSALILNNVFDNLVQTFNANIKFNNERESLYVVVNENYPYLMLVNNKDKNKLEAVKQKFICQECNEGFADACGLKEHCLSEHNTLICDECFDICSNQEELTTHNESIEKLKCTDCNTYRCTEDSLKLHNDKCHTPIVCKECGKLFKGLDKLQVHEEKHIKKSNCPKCGKKYLTKEFYLKHVKLCLEDQLELHPMRSKIVKTYACDKCDKAYSTPGGLRVHTKFSHGNGKQYVCNVCNKAFSAQSYLKTHMIKHTGEKNFKCTICNNKFVSKEALLYHTRRHTGEKPYSCKLCDEKFVNSSARAEHIKFKHIGPTLMCNICSRKFVTPNFLRQHMKKHHDRTNKLYSARSLVRPDVPSIENMRVKLESDLTEL